MTPKTSLPTLRLWKTWFDRQVPDYKRPEARRETEELYDDATADRAGAVPNKTLNLTEATTLRSARDPVLGRGSGNLALSVGRVKSRLSDQGERGGPR